jgi:hypothetical protein
LGSIALVELRVAVIPLVPSSSFPGSSFAGSSFDVGISVGSARAPTPPTNGAPLARSKRARESEALPSARDEEDTRGIGAGCGLVRQTNSASDSQTRGW